MSAERIVAALMGLICLIFLARLALGPARQQRFDAALRRLWQALRSVAQRLRRWPSTVRQKKAHQAHAAKVAQDAIDRARRGVERDGNVIRPKAFKGRDEDQD